MQVALDGADAYLADGLHTLLGHQGPQKLGAHVHGPGGDQDLGDKDLVVLEFLADHVHAVEQTLVQDLLNRNALVNGLLDKLLDDLGLTALQVLRNLV